MLVVIDIETKAGPLPTTFPPKLAEDMALDALRNEITLIAWETDQGQRGIETSVDQLNKLIPTWRAQGAKFGGHNFKFDLRTLITKGALFSPADLNEDSMLQARANPNKIPEVWLANYEAKRKLKNEMLEESTHRKSGIHGLKTLAPYVLGVEPFWETADHANAEYAAKDATYTLRLIQKQAPMLDQVGAQEFYRTLIGWSQMFLSAELKGLRLNEELMDLKWEESKGLHSAAETELKTLWQDPISFLEGRNKDELRGKYMGMAEAALIKPSKKPKDPLKVKEKYDALFEAALEKLEPFNLDSPSQIKWVMKDFYGLNIDNMDGDESTGKEVLHKLSDEGRQDAKAMLSYREHSKLLTAFFPSYKALAYEGRLHPSFHLATARTGRTSSSLPNVQQVPGDLHDLIIPSPGRKFICKDYDNGEPLLIAYLTECPILCDIMLKGESFHDHNVISMYELDVKPDQVKTLYPFERALAKETGLSLLYGAGTGRLMAIAQKAGRPLTERQARNIFNRFKEKYKEVFKYKKELDKRLEMGDIVTNLLGRKYKIDDKHDVHMKGFNTLVQGSLSDLLVHSCYNITQQAPHLDFLASIHDEVIFEVDQSLAAEAEKLVDASLTRWTLNTKYGTIKLKTSGGIFDHWKH